MIVSLFSATLDWLAHGLWGLSWWQIVLYTLLTTHVTIASVTIFLHRHQAHRALDLHLLPSHFFRFWLWIGTGQVTREWVAIHRKHHARCETSEDPHSPVAHGIKKVLWQGTELYRAESKNQETLNRFGAGCPNDWLERNLYTRFSWQGVGLMMILDLALFGAIGLTVWAVQMVWIPLMAAGVINGVGHWWGYRNAETPDASTNIVPWGVVIGGEELHNNHHTYPTAAKFSVKSYEFDIGWSYIRFLELCGLAWVKAVPPQLVINKTKLDCDGETLEALIAFRFVALKKLQELTKQLWADSVPRKKLEVFEVRLKQLWTDSSASKDQLVRDLRQWCVDAEKSEIPGLQVFAFLLPGYTLKKHSR
ncbi:MAG: fatty acid desaturase [Candidatus Moranbacteria bacterium]|nr:fatty acid desaturase [Candidatus Moranbacteria bacterium]